LRIRVLDKAISSDLDGCLFSWLLSARRYLAISSGDGKAEKKTIKVSSKMRKPA
jgi:hypothetical protein